MGTSTSRTPFHEREYTQNEPLLEVLVGLGELKKKVVAYVDTGCSTCLYFCKSYVKREGLVLGEKINKDPIPFGVADGHTINGDYYKATCNIGGEEREIIVSVIDPETFFLEQEPEIKDVRPLLGRGILDCYDTLFKGKERKMMLYHPE
jgi:hypothetical protein